MIENLLVFVLRAMFNAHAEADRPYENEEVLFMKLGKKIVSMLMAVTTVATMVASAGAVGSYSGVNMTNGVGKHLQQQQHERLSDRYDVQRK